MSDLQYDIERWNSATSLLPWGLQSVLKDALQLVADGKIKMCWGVDSYDGSPCLINAVSPMISASAVTPANKYPMLVSVFDSLNMNFDKRAYEPSADKWLVTHLAATTMVRHFGPMNPKPEVTEYTELAMTETLDRLLAESATPETAEEITDATSSPSDR